MEHHDFGGRGLMRDAVITVAVVVLAVAALDDITTDTALSFPLERTALLGCGVWFLVVAWRLWRQGHRVLGVLSFGLVSIAALAHPTIGPGTGSMASWVKWAGYLATLGTLAWFLLMAGVGAWSGWHPRRSNGDGAQ